jgi:hypothetical protein
MGGEDPTPGGLAMEDGGRRPLKVGLVLPHLEDWMGGATARGSDLVAMARRAEGLGFDSLWLVDHFWYRFPLDDSAEPQPRVWECWSPVAALATATSRIELGTLVTCTSYERERSTSPGRTTRRGSASSGHGDRGQPVPPCSWARWASGCCG